MAVLLSYCVSGEEREERGQSMFGSSRAGWLVEAAGGEIGAAGS